ncbi:phage tail assembly protein T [Escherichia coli]|nr:phage tail assembly protein T [Escherichia coli]
MGRPDWRAMLAGMTSTEYADWRRFYRTHYFHDTQLDMHFSGLTYAVLSLFFCDPDIWMPGIGIAASNIMFSMGSAMALGGVAQMLAPKAKTPEYKSTDNGKQNTYFSSLDNMIAQGNPVPVPYGEMLVGSRRISQDISTRDEGGDGKVVVIGRG